MADEVEFIEEDDPREEAVQVTVSFAALEKQPAIAFKYSVGVRLMSDWLKRDKRKTSFPKCYSSPSGVIALDLAKIVRMTVAVRNQARFIKDVEGVSE